MARRSILPLIALMCVAVLTACGSSATEDATPPRADAAAASTPDTPSTTPAEPDVQEAPETTTAPETEKAPPKGPSLPDVTVQDLAGGTVNVADLASGDTPVLVWFWAPHCPSCNAEAADVERFAKANERTVEVVGLGTQDSVREARDFVREHDLRTPRMLYDPSFKSWQQLGIRGQPAAMLFDRDGVARGQWFGPIDEAQVLDIAARI